MNTLKEYNTFDLIDELTQRAPDELEYSIFILLVQKKIDYKQLSDMYVKALESWNDDEKNKFLEAVSCVLDQMIYHKQKDDHVIQRCLYLLNESGAFQTNELNKKYNYNKDEAKKLSWYERNKHKGD